jgi:hypothetical protein
MSHVTPHTAGLVASLKRELTIIDRELGKLLLYRDAIQRLLVVHNHARPRGSGSDRARQGTEAPVDTDAIADTSVAIPDDIPAPDDGPNPLEMARTVLQNAGNVMSVLALRAAIRMTYGLDPDATLDQLLYKRAQLERGFYRTRTGEFGLLNDPRPPLRRPAVVITPVDVPAAAYA